MLSSFSPWIPDHTHCISARVYSCVKLTFRVLSLCSSMLWSVSKCCFLSVGLTWEDDTTQKVLSKELSKLRRIPFRPQQNGPVYNTDSRFDTSLPISRSVLWWEMSHCPTMVQKCFFFSFHQMTKEEKLDHKMWFVNSVVKPSMRRVL